MVALSRAQAAPMRRASTLVGLLGALMLAAPAASADDPEIALSTTDAAAGQSITVTGQGWPSSEDVVVALCADPDADGSLVCAEESQQEVVVSWDGYFSTDLTLVALEEGCPCVIRVDSESAGDLTETINLSAGRASGDDATGVLVESATLVGGGGLASWFGGAPSPDLEVTVRNADAKPADLAISLEWRDGDKPPVPVRVPSVEPLAPDETRTIVVPLQFDAWSQGGHTVEGVVAALDATAPFEAEMTVAPWGLYALVVAAIALAVAWRERWLFVPQTSPAPARSGLDESDPEALALSLIERSVSSAAPRVPRQPVSERPAPRSAARPATPAEEASWVDMDPVEMIERSTVSGPQPTVPVPQQRGTRAERSPRLRDRIGGISRR